MTQANDIRKYVLKNFIHPARKRGDSTVRVCSKEVHKGLGLKNHFPAVCSALDTDLFIEEAKVTLVQRSGPHQSSTVEWVFALK